MITDTQLNSIAVGFGFVAMALIVTYQILDSNVVAETKKQDEE
ncbi:Oligosaccharyltransferase complex subunit [Komagataella phaffii CBS 7435]|uniref:Oligosaccharyltransferase complex subunit n=1 Tax=Komagataella phaffii (strain ATCC 76273 / CBS 7435 / CECT 11047 / NRRL Y-11430 / Wegner 21-1) TaxID=981350 RepID=A0A1G4KPL6_KOMPC|nr:Oligosaccharyltransferase complex subunit [Komagataella phaffii CBS 7435]SCV11958.1 Oligosaccharyltransferase complex subunit [Komagataella phaffii CBS 7435]